MKPVLFHLVLAGMTIACAQTMTLPAYAQVTVDGTLKTSVGNVGNDFTITNGTAKGSNLFHSFAQFSIPTGGSATFDLGNTANITTIFSRVTGGIPSNIDGTIRTTNSTNPVSLFLLNPSGVLFGANASLNISGSLIATTASSIKFADGTEFSGMSAIEPPLLTISMPVGLQMGQNPGAITNQSQNPGGLFGFPAGLTVQSGGTIALIGGNISIVGSGIYAPDGRIELGSVASNSFVQILSTNPVWRFGYSQVQAFGNISLTLASALVTDGNGGGSLQLQGKQITLYDGSFIYNNTFGSQDAGDITVRASEGIELKGIDPYGYNLPSAIFGGTRTGSTGNGGNILIETPHLRLVGGGQIGTNTESTGNAGNLMVRSQNIDLIGASQYFINPSGLYLNVQRRASGRGGELSITTDHLLLADGAEISTATRGDGNAANIFIQAKNIEVAGSLGDTTFQDLLPTLITSQVDQNAIGNGGNLSIDAERLSIRNGARVSTETYGTGNAGTLLAKATQAIEITGTSPYNTFASALTTGVQPTAVGQGGNLIINTGLLSLTKGGQAITSTLGQGNSGNIDILANRVDVSGQSNDSQFISRLAATSNSASAAGSIAISVDRLTVQNGAEISVSGFSTGTTGNLDIRANSIELTNAGRLQATVSAGDRGNININSNLLLLRNQSTITTSASNLANGGNITLNAPIILGLENSDIIANAVQGQGGNINITTQGLFGLKYRPSLTPENDITASSQYGINGAVQVNNFGVNPDSGLLKLPVDPIDPNQRIAQGCKDSQDNSFVITRRGGIPANPMQQLNGYRAWADLRNFSKPGRFKVSTQSSVLTPLVEATSWRRNPMTGEVELIAPQSLPSLAIATCAPSP